MKKLALVLLAVVAVASAVSAAGYEKGTNVIGPLLGFGWHNLMIGGQYEHGFHKNISGGAIVGWSHESEDFLYGEWSWNYIAIGGQANWHFKPGEKFDPFVGAVLGYNIASVSTDWDDPTYEALWGHYYEATGSEMLLGANLGMNYDLSPSAAFVARLGYPYYLAAGLNFKF